MVRDRKLPAGWDPQDCPACMEFYFDQPLLPMAAASVGIEHGKSTGQMLREYLAAFHRRGHKEVERG